MKQKFFLLVAIIVMATNVHASDSRGMGLWQDLDRAVNFKNPKDHAEFLRDGNVFPGFNKNLIYGVSKGTPVSWSEYESQTKEIAATSLQSLVTVLNTVNSATQNGIGKKFGVTYITPEIALAVLESDMVTVGTLPVGDIVTFDTYNKFTHGLGSITRSPHFLKAVGEWEMFLFINVDGYEPIPVRSGFCGNNIATVSVVKYIHKKPEQVEVVVDTIYQPKPCPKGTISENCPKGSITNVCPKGSISGAPTGTGSISGQQPKGLIEGVPNTNNQPKGSIDNGNGSNTTVPQSNQPAGWSLKTD